MSAHFVIIGNGAAGYRAAKALRRADGDAQVSVFTDEFHPFYLRRQLGEYVAGNLTLPEVIFQSRNAYRRERIDLLLGTRVARIDPRGHAMLLASGQRVQYDRLLVATGTQAVPLEIPGMDLEGVTTFDTLEAAGDVRQRLKDVRQAAILGEGVIGLTLAESLVGRGIRVAQMIRGDRFWPEILDAETSALVEAILEDSGVTLRRNQEPRAVIGAADRAIGVETTDGETFPADLVACGCRRRPALDLVDGAGLDVGRGIRVDASLQTSQADVFAAGDVAEPVAGDDAAAEDAPFCWQRAWAQGGLAAASMLGHRAAPALEAVRIRTMIFGHDLAVIGRGHLDEGGDIAATEQREPPSVFRRLVYEKGLLVGAIVFGTGETVHELNRLVAERAPRDAVEVRLGLAQAPEGADRLPRTFAGHCPICAAELVVHHGTQAGAVLTCHVCNTDLVVCWDGQRGWLDVGRP